MNNNTKDIIDFTFLYNKHKRNLYNYVLRMLNDKMQAEDIVQNVFLKLFEKFNEIRDKNSIIFWLFTTARNEIFTIFRNKKTHVDKYNVYDTDQIDILNDERLEVLYEKKELKEMVLEEIKKLTNEHREVYVLKEYSQMSYKEIAELLKLDEDLVKSRLFKARQKLIQLVSKAIIE